VRIAGICDTDLQLAQGYMSYQGILGHEFVGETEEGRRCTAEINNACRSCPICLSGSLGHCPFRTVLGILGHDGAMADLVAVPERNLHWIPDSVEDCEAVFIEPLAAAFRITEQVELSPATLVAILGDGKLGLLCTWTISQSGAQVHLVGRHEEKLALAGRGVVTHLAGDASRLRREFDVVIDATGSPSGLESALSLVRPCGTVVLKTTVAGRYEVDMAPIVIDEVRLLGSRCGPFPKAIEALRARSVDVRPLIGALYPLDEADAAFCAAGLKGAKKVLLTVRS
jgi:threonine dehydrogenase-like Zn-dependent dehydrogenase